MTLRDALYHMVHRNAIPAKQQADELGIAYSYLCNAANPNLEGQGFDYQLRLLIPHTRLTQDFAALDYIEQALGRVAVPLSRCDCRAPADLRQGLLLVAKELGEAAAALEHSLRDGQISNLESARCQQELWELIAAAVAVYEQLTQRP